MSVRTQLIVAGVLTVAMVGTATRVGDAPAPESAPAAAQEAPAPAPQAPDKALIARGDSVYHGKLGGAICTTCHGQDAKGLAGMGPNLTDKEWLHGDGSRKFLEAIVRTGVTKPKKSALAMPPFGGVPLDSAKVTAVAAYLHSLGAPK